MLIGCDFCLKKKFYPMNIVGDGTKTMSTMLKDIFGKEEDDAEIDPSGSGIRLFPVTDDGFFLEYDNSDDEYADGYFKINYCPICGRKLNGWLGSIRDDENGRL